MLPPVEGEEDKVEEIEDGAAGGEQSAQAQRRKLVDQSKSNIPISNPELDDLKELLE